MLGAPVFRTALFGPWSGNALWTAARAVPSLDLPFADSKSLVDAITGRQLISYARAGSGTYTDSAKVLQTAATDVPRFDHNPLTGESLGLLVEEQRTNSIRNNTMVGADAGTPGTAPTNWFGNSTVAGITRQIVGTGIEDGINYIDYRIAGTTTSTLFFGIGPELSTAVAATNGQTWTFSSYARLIAGSLAGFTQLNFYVVFNNSSGTGVQFVTGGIAPTSAALGTQRFTRVATASNATTAFVQPAFQFEALSGASIDVTLRIGLPQLEQGAFATSPIPTTTAAATRNADVAQITGTNFSSWYRQDEGTWFTEGAVPPGLSVFPTLHQESDGTGNNLTSQYVHTSGYYTNVRVGNVVQGDPGVTATPVVGAAYKIASGLRVDNAVTAANGALSPTDTSLLMPAALSEMRIGASRTGGSAINTTIKRLAFWPQALPGQLQAITQP